MAIQSLSSFYYPILFGSSRTTESKITTPIITGAKTQRFDSVDDIQRAPFIHYIYIYTYIQHTFMYVQLNTQTRDITILTLEDLSIKRKRVTVKHKVINRAEDLLLAFLVWQAMVRILVKRPEALLCTVLFDIARIMLRLQETLLKRGRQDTGCVQCLQKEGV